MDDLGAPASYLTLETGVPVVSSDGTRLGEVEHVLSEPDADVFDGIVLDRSVLPGGHRFVDADQIGQIYERGVQLNIEASAAERLPEPSENPAALEVNPGEEEESDIERKLRRAWDLITGKG